MIVLALDTCFNACSVAITDARGQLLGADRQLMRQGHAEALLPMVDRVAGLAGIAIRDIERIAVTHGPGTFTGVRTGLAAARGLALAKSIPALGFSSLRAIGIAASDDVVVAMDAGRGRLFVQVIGADGREITEPQLCSVVESAVLIRRHALPVIGNGFDVLLTAGHDVHRAAGEIEPDARMLIPLALRADMPSSPPQPLYLREPDARPQETKAIARQR